jgi:hypothetical protein
VTGTGRARVRTLLLVALVAASCTAVRPRLEPTPAAATAPAAFHADLDAVLQRVVDDAGRIDYPALADDPATLERSYAWLAAISPDSHPALFPTADARLTYWLNAYNAAVLTTVVRHYPIASVRDVRPPAALFFLPRLAGFFVLQRLTLGGARRSLYDLENRIVRRRFPDPRVHFALNCASASCPRLPRRAFTAAHLDAELDRETRRFIAEPRNVRVDPAARRIHLSSIFDWYERDFLDWLKQRHPERAATLPAYVARYLPPADAAAVTACRDCTVTFVPYDWSLNDQAAR